MTDEETLKFICVVVPAVLARAHVLLESIEKPMRIALRLSKPDDELDAASLRGKRATEAALKFLETMTVLEAQAEAAARTGSQAAGFGEPR